MGQARSQNVLFPVMGPVFVNCGDPTEPSDILAITMTGPVDGVSITLGTTDCTAGAANMLTFTHEDQLLPRAACMDELVLIRRRWTATDACGFMLTQEQLIFIRDDVAPTITCQDITVNANLSGMSSISVSDIVISAVDDCQGVGTAGDPVMELSQSEFSLCSGTMNVMASAMDACGNVGECSSTVTVESSCPTSLGCNGQVNVSLSFNCDVEIHPDLIIEDTNMQCPLQVRIFDVHDVLTRVTDTSTFPYTFPVLDASYVGSRWRTEVFYEDCSGAEISCWGWISVEDKIQPPVTCINDFEVSCKDDLSNLFTSSSTAEFCVNGPDLDSDIATTTLAIELSSGSVNPWEVITGVTSTTNLMCSAGAGAGAGGGTTGTGGTGGTGSGTGSGTTGGAPAAFSGFTIGGIEFPLTCSDNGVSGFDVLTGLSVTSLTDGMATITIPAGTLPPGGLCFTVQTQSFGSYNPDNCDDNAEVVITSDVLDENECGNSGFVALRRITYRIVDSQGSTSMPCSVDINFAAEPLSGIQFPPDFSHNNGVECIGIDDVTPAVTGMPTLNGCTLEEGNLCKLNVSFEDMRLDNGGLLGPQCSSFLIRRQWTILDWCLGEYRQAFQEINVIDASPPICSTAPDLTINTTQGCAADFLVTPFIEGSDTEIIVLSDCSGVTIDRVEYTRTRDAFSFDPSLGEIFEARNNGNDTYSLTDLGIGQHWVRYVVVDGCTNTNETQCFFEITVQDANPPIAVCDQYTAVALADNGWGRVIAAAIDDGSFAPCGGDVDIAVRRLSNSCDAALMDRDDTVFGPFVQFCCEEAGQSIPVQLRVTDASGASSSCEVNVVVQDKNNDSTVTCPSPGTITINDCSDSDPSDRFGSPSLSGQCVMPEIIDVIDNNNMSDDCGVGTFTRTWIIGVNGNAAGAQNCTQTIRVTGNDGLSASSFRFPSDVTLTDCTDFSSGMGMAPTINGVPVSDANLCARLAYSFSDVTFLGADGFCAKILRTWTVINWCVFDPVTNPDEGIYTGNQIILIENNIPPVLTGCTDNDTISLSAQGEDCVVLADLPVPMAVDACFGEDLPASDFSWTLSGPGGDSNGTGDTASQELGVGTHVLLWSIDGGCQSTATCSVTVVVDDGNGGPETHCRANITAVISSNGPSGMPTVIVEAADFDLGSSDRCGGPLSVSFSADDPNDTEREFNCTQVGNRSVNVYFTDADGNQDFCVTTVVIQANGAICDTIGSLVLDIEGLVHTETFQRVEDVDVELWSQSAGPMGMALTDSEGHYAFSSMTGNSDYRLSAISGDDYLNGVSTLDLVMIQRHILAIENLDSPYKLIAADINGDERINGIDLVELRKLILGIYAELPQNDSWNYVNADYQFADATQPWPYDEDITLYQIDQDMTDNDFVAVKVGDVNEDAILNLSETVEQMGQDQVRLVYESLDIDNGQYLLPISFNQDLQMTGLQFELVFSEDIDVIGIEKGRLNLADTEFLLDGGQLRVSASRAEAFSSKQGEALFYVVVASDHALSSCPYGIAYQSFRSELYTDDLAQVEILDPDMDIESPVLFQNMPNPFSEGTRIGFQLPSSCEVVLTVMDANGQRVKTISGQYAKGRHELQLGSEALSGNGIYYYKLEACGHTATRKMIRID